MDGFTIYHNPRWGKSRQTLQLLRDNSIEPIIINYLINIPSQNEIKSLAKKLGKRPAEFVRKGEKDFKENTISNILDNDQEMVSAMHQYPKIIERPIIVKGDQAVLGRPPENILELI